MPLKKQSSQKVRKEKKEAKKLKTKVPKHPKITKEELNKEIDIFLTSKNPYESENSIEFDRKTQSFKPVFAFKKPVVFYQNTGSLRRRLIGSYGVVYEEVDEENGKMRNKFNFRCVATQTEATHPTDQNDAIDPTFFPVLKFCGAASKAEIVAAYKEHENQQKRTHKNDWMNGDISTLLKYVGRKDIKLKDSNRYYLRLSERMLDQNMSKANLDFTYYDNPNDEFTPNFGSLLPLWSLSNRSTKNMQVTSIGWNCHYPDLFAVGFRALRDTITEEDDDDDDLGIIREIGCVCVYSLKGPSYPEKIIECPSAVCCVQFHPQLSFLLAVARTGGDLTVYDLRKEGNPSAGRHSKFEKHYHDDTISEIQWLQDKLPQKLCSVSYDGKVIKWLFLMNNLFPGEVIASLKLKELPVEPPPKGLEMNLEPKREPKDTLVLNTSGTTISVNNREKDSFLVGTVAGIVHKYSFDDKKCEGSYKGHSNSVNRVVWNPFHPRVFLSCSKDLTVQVWEHSQKQSLFEFVFASGVKDVAWAPFSSTLFAVISGYAMINIVDLAINKVEAIGTYVVYTPKQNIELTRVQFHPCKPVLIIGDEKGNVILFKLSPNLRSNLKGMSTLEKSQFVTGEIEKMDQLLKVSINPKNM